MSTIDNSNDEKPRKILCMGTSPLMSHIVINLLANQNNRLVVLDRKPPALIFDNPELARYQGIGRIGAIHMSPHDIYSHGVNFNDFDIIINNYCVHDSKYSSQNPRDTEKINITFTEDFMSKLGEDKFEGTLIHLSTAKVYGYKARGETIKPIKENAEVNPVGIKAKTRWKQELVIQEQAEKNDTRYLIFRLGTIIGKFTPLEGMLNQWIISGLTKDDYHVYGITDRESKESRDFVNVHDVGIFLGKELVDLITDDAIAKKSYNQVYNLGGGHKYEPRIQNYSEMVKTLFNSGSTWRGSTNTRYHGYHDAEVEQNLRIWLDNTKTTNLLAYKPTWGIYAQKIIPDIALFLAYQAMSFTDKMMYYLERNFGIFNEQRRTKLIQAGEINEKGPSQYVAQNIDNFMNNRYEGM